MQDSRRCAAFDNAAPPCKEGNGLLASVDEKGGGVFARNPLMVWSFLI